MLQIYADRLVSCLVEAHLPHHVSDDDETDSIRLCVCLCPSAAAVKMKMKVDTRVITTGFADNHRHAPVCLVATTK